MVTCIKDPPFLRVVDSKRQHKDANYQLFQIFTDAIEEVELENVMQIMTNATYVSRAMEKLVEATYKHIWWTPYVHAMNNALKDISMIN